MLVTYLKNTLNMCYKRIEKTNRQREEKFEKREGELHHL